MSGPGPVVAAAQIAMGAVRDQLAALLADAATALREDLVIEFECSANWQGREQGPEPGSIDADQEEFIAGRLDQLRRIEAKVPRALGAGPGWLNDILDGRRSL